MAGATCLTLIANCVHNEIVEPVITFVKAHLNSTDWHHREAATMAFAAILEGVYDLNETILLVCESINLFPPSSTPSALLFPVKILISRGPLPLPPLSLFSLYPFPRGKILTSRVWHVF